MKFVKYVFNKPKALVLGLSVLVLVLVPVTAFAMTSDTFQSNKSAWVDKNCKENKNNELFASICYLVYRDSEQQDEIEGLTNRVDSLEGAGGNSGGNLMVEIGGVLFGPVVRTENYLQFFDQTNDRLVNITQLGDTASNINITEHFGDVVTVSFEDWNCTGDAYVTFNSPVEKDKLLNYVLLNGVNEHYVADRSSEAKFITVRSFKYLDQQAKTSTCGNDDGDRIAEAVKVIPATMPVEEPLNRPFIFSYQ